ncbi:MAG: septation protein IspZ [Rickettsiales bacterium]
MKQIIEFIPLLLFFITYSFTDIITATVVLAISSIIAFLVILAYSKKVTFMPLFSAIIIGFFGFLTWYLQNPIFIKIKPTILNFSFGLIFLISYFLKKPLVKLLLQQALKMEEHYWLVMTYRWGLFFIFLAILNEFIWRNFSEDFWVSFKVFGMMPITLIFTLAQMPFIIRHQIK